LYLGRDWYIILDSVWINSAEEKGKPWVLKAQLTDSRLAVQHIKFAPVHLGLKLVCYLEA